MHVGVTKIRCGFRQIMEVMTELRVKVAELNETTNLARAVF
jgi:hypothetical protein